MHQITNRRRRLAVTIVAAAIALPGAMPAATALAHHESGVIGTRTGSQGDSVRAIQEALIEQGFMSGVADGVFGAGTEASLKRLQAYNGLPQTGVVGEATAIALGVKRSTVYGLAEGDRGDRVRALQQALVAAGFDVGADGVFGAGTASAVKSFQRSKGYMASGKVNAATAAALGDVKAPPAPAPAAEPAAAANPPAEPAEAAEADRATASQGGFEGLRIGARGDAVVRVQRALMGAGFTVIGGADGIYGALTANAVRSFQGVNGLKTTGAVDAATAAAIKAIEGSSGGGQQPKHDPSVKSPLVGLKYGALGSDVAALQQALIAAGHRPAGGADGIFGPATRGALEAFQAARKLAVTGQVDAATASALSAGSGATSSMVGLRAGSLGSVVVELQTALEQAGFRPRGGADGIFGPATAQALKNFQSGQGLDATGVVDAATAKALDAPKPVAAKSSSGGFAMFGEKGARVTALQSALVQAGLSFRGGVDGSFGGATSGAVMEFQRRNGLAVTGKVDGATAKALGLQEGAAPAAPDPSTVKLKAFPVQGPCHYSDTWLYSRGSGRLHLGVDIIAAEGQQLFAVADGTVTKVYRDGPGSLSGNGLRISQPDGTYFFYAHLLSIADGIEQGTKVKAGQVVGLNGSTGSSGTPHLHLEIHPKGGAAINPYPLVKAIDAC